MCLIWFEKVDTSRREDNYLLTASSSQCPNRIQFHRPRNAPIEIHASDHILRLRVLQLPPNDPGTLYRVRGILSPWKSIYVVLHIFLYRCYLKSRNVCVYSHSKYFFTNCLRIPNNLLQCTFDQTADAAGLAWTWTQRCLPYLLEQPVLENSFNFRDLFMRKEPARRVHVTYPSFSSSLSQVGQTLKV